MIHLIHSTVRQVEHYRVTQVFGATLDLGPRAHVTTTPAPVESLFPSTFVTLNKYILQNLLQNLKPHSVSFLPSFHRALSQTMNALLPLT